MGCCCPKPRQNIACNNTDANLNQQTNTDMNQHLRPMINIKIQQDKNHLSYPQNCIGKVTGSNANINIKKKYQFPALLIDQNLVLVLGIDNEIKEAFKYKAKLLYYPEPNQIKSNHHITTKYEYKIYKQFCYGLIQLNQKEKRKNYLKIGINLSSKGKSQIFYGYGKEGKQKQKIIEYKLQYEIKQNSILRFKKNYILNWNSGGAIMIKRENQFIVVAIYMVKDNNSQKQSNFDGKIITEQLLNDFIQQQKKMKLKIPISYINLGQNNEEIMNQKSMEQQNTQNNLIPFKKIVEKQEIQQQIQLIKQQYQQKRKILQEQNQSIKKKLQDAQNTNKQIKNYIKQIKEIKNSNIQMKKEIQNSVKIIKQQYQTSTYKLSLKMNEQISFYKDQIIEKNIKINSLKRTIQENKIQYQQCLEQQLNIIKDQKSQIQAQINQLIKQKQQLFKKLQKYQQKEANLMNQSNQQKQNKKKISEIIQKNKFSKFSKHFSWDEKMKHSKNYQINQSKVTKSANNSSWYQITSKYPLQKNQYNNLKFKIHNYGSKQSEIYIGIISERWKYAQSCTGQQVVQFCSSNKYREGSIAVDGNDIKPWHPDWFLGNGQLIMQIDLSQAFQITFKLISEQQLSYTHKLINKHWQTKDIFVYVLCSEQGDSVQLVR